MDDHTKSQPAADQRHLLRDFMRMVRRTHRAPDLVELAQALLSQRGEASGVVLASEILSTYEGFARPERRAFLNALLTRFGPDHARLERAIERYRASPSPQNGMTLHAAAEPRRQELIRRLNLAPKGTERLVRMREDLLRAIEENRELDVVDADFRHLFTSWFNRGFLLLQRVDWRTPAAVLEKIIRYEAVHEISSWEDLRRRIDPDDRRCFAFFHPTLAGEPLIFVEVALTNEPPDAIAPLLDSGVTAIAASAARTAVFYSISNCQVGLRGVPLGNFLIKQVVEELRRELPGLKRFVTLSPVPGFAEWLRVARDAKGPSGLKAEDKALLKIVETNGWHTDVALARSVRPVLTAAIAEFLLRARGATGKVLDSVARFHLSNGARLERINWLGDVSPKGLAQSLGFMVNYLYDVRHIEHNHEVFAKVGDVVASRPVRQLLRAAAEI
jgi:malonyl-CoA decarboxylase